MQGLDTGSTARSWWREPLLHFALIGVLFFALYTYVAAPADEDDRQIVVSRDSLVTYLQYRMRRFGDGQAMQLLDSMSEPEFKRVLDDYVREEVLYRQALALGMDRNDDVRLTGGNRRQRGADLLQRLAEALAAVDRREQQRAVRG